MLIAITPDPRGGFWLTIRTDIPRIFCGSRAIAITVLEQNARGIVR